MKPFSRKPANSPWVQALVASKALEAIPSGQVQLRWTDRWQVLSDDPMKALSKDDPLERSAVLRGVVTATEQTTNSIKFISPYFVSGPNGTPWLTGLAASGREVLVLTNTLAATDVAAVHGGYSKFRKKLLEGGVGLWELKPDPTYKSPRSMFGSSGASLHTKGAIFDQHTVMIGSFNLDPRSVSLNCEQGVFVTDPVLAAQLEAQFQKMIAGSSAWKVELDADGKLQWSDGVQTLRKEPDASFWRKAQAWLTRLLPFESQL
jgi:putative cardiolipin synthase